MNYEVVYNVEISGFPEVFPPKADVLAPNPLVLAPKADVLAPKPVGFAPNPLVFPPKPDVLAPKPPPPPKGAPKLWFAAALPKAPAGVAAGFRPRVGGPRPAAIKNYSKKYLLNDGKK